MNHTRGEAAGWQLPERGHGKTLIMNLLKRMKFLHGTFIKQILIELLQSCLIIKVYQRLYNILPQYKS